MKSIDQIAAELGRLDAGTPASPRRRTRDYPDPARQEDHDYRQAYGTAGKRPFGRGLRAAFYAYLPDAPTGRFVTRDDAVRYVRKIQEVIDMQTWPRHERERLRVLLRRWEKRARGDDARFNAIGLQVGPNEKHRPKTAGDVLAAIRELVLKSAGTTPPGAKFVTDPKWPLGRPV
jgi:hypothetical protein